MEEHYKKIQSRLRSFQKKDENMAIRQILITAIPFILLFIGCFFVYDYNKWLCLFFAPIIASYMSRLFMFMHDCGHRTFFKNNKANEYLGNILGFFLLVPFGMWKYIHIIHHASAGNLDKRDKNPDLWTMTVKEYIESKWHEKLFYKIYRSHFMWLFIIPNFIFFILFRIPHKKLNKIAKKTVLIHDLLYVLIILLVTLFIPLSKLLFIYMPPLLLAFSLGGWIFYIQHQYEETYWASDKEWSFEEASLKGSSFWKMPKLLQWITANIGFHHVHHLNMNIPNYNLEEAHNAIVDLIDINPIPIEKTFTHLKFKLWDEEKKKLIRYKDI